MAIDLEVINLNTEEGAQSVTHPPAPVPNQAEALAKSAADPIAYDRVEVSIPDSALLGPVKAPMQLAVDPAVPQPADMIVRSGDDLALPHSDALSESAIHQLITQLAAFCIDQLEKSVASSNGVDLNKDTDALEDKF